MSTGTPGVLVLAGFTEGGFPGVEDVSAGSNDAFVADFATFFE